MRNYKKESQWRNKKYIRFDVPLDRQQYEPDIKEIDKTGRARWLRRAIAVWKKWPELWKEN